MGTRKRIRRRISVIERINNTKMLLAREYAKENFCSLKEAIRNIELIHEIRMLDARDKMDLRKQKLNLI